MSDGTETPRSSRSLSAHQIFLRGLAISLPAILTIVILLWLIGGINAYIIQPTTSSVKYVIAMVIDQSIAVRHKNLVRLESGPDLPYCDAKYLVAARLNQAFPSRRRRILREELALRPDIDAGEGSILDNLDLYALVESKSADWLKEQAIEAYDATRDPPYEVYVPLDGRAVPYADYVFIARDTPAADMPTSATGLYMEYAVRQYVGSAFTLSAFALSLVIIVIYFLGRFVSVRLGSWVVGQVETRLLGRLPVIRNVYGSAKQVTDFLFSENQVEYRRVVAIEYPRRGIWSLALVTGEGMLDITTAVGEPCVSVLVPSSPMPVTGYTMCLPRSSVLDVDVTVDQAFQFCISCGVLVPGNQKVTPELLQQEMARRLAERMQDNPADRRTIHLPPQVSTRDDEIEGSQS